MVTCSMFLLFPIIFHQIKFKSLVLRRIINSVSWMAIRLWCIPSNLLDMISKLQLTITSQICLLFVAQNAQKRNKIWSGLTSSLLRFFWIAIQFLLIIGMWSLITLIGLWFLFQSMLSLCWSWKNANLTNAQKELLLWWWKLGIRMPLIQKLTSVHTVKEPNVKHSMPTVITPKFASTSKYPVSMCTFCELASAKKCNL